MEDAKYMKKPPDVFRFFLKEQRTLLSPEMCRMRAGLCIWESWEELFTFPLITITKWIQRFPALGQVDVFVHLFSWALPRAHRLICRDACAVSLSQEEQDSYVMEAEQQRLLLHFHCDAACKLSSFPPQMHFLNPSMQNSFIPDSIRQNPVTEEFTTPHTCLIQTHTSQIPAHACSPRSPPKLTSMLFNSIAALQPLLWPRCHVTT